MISTLTRKMPTQHEPATSSQLTYIDGNLQGRITDCQLVLKI